MNAAKEAALQFLLQRATPECLRCLIQLLLFPLSPRLCACPAVCVCVGCVCVCCVNLCVQTECVGEMAQMTFCIDALWEV